MSYHWEKILAPDEVLQKEFSISPYYRRASLALVLLCSIILFSQIFYIGILVIFLGWLYWLYLTKAKHYAFTNKRIILVESFWGTSITSIDYAQITDIEIEQSAIDQMGRWGTLIINTAGTYAPEVHLQFIDNPEGIKQELDTIRDKTTEK